jgi:hypothetical protein
MDHTICVIFSWQLVYIREAAPGLLLNPSRDLTSDHEILIFCTNKPPIINLFLSTLLNNKA